MSEDNSQDQDPDVPDTVDETEDTEPYETEPPKIFDPNDDEFVAVKREFAAQFGNKRHICKKNTMDHWDSYCGRKRAPHGVVGHCLEVTDAYDLLLNTTEVCPTCASKSNLKSYVDFEHIRALAREGSLDTDRIPVRADLSLEIDFPGSAKHDLIEAVVRAMQAAGKFGGPTTPPDAIDKEGIVNAIDLGPAAEVEGEVDDN